MEKFNVKELDGNKVYYLLTYLKSKYRLCIPTLGVIGLISEDKVNDFTTDFIDLYRSAYKEEVMYGDGKFYLLTDGSEVKTEKKQSGRKSNKSSNKGKK